MTKREVENFFLERKGYLKKSPIKVAQRLWKGSTKNQLPKNESELQKELDLITNVMRAMRVAKTIEQDTQEVTLQDLYHKILNEKDRPKRILYFDLEVSANIVFSWRIGRDINISHDDIIQERAIICACYKWSDEDEVHFIQWDKGNDKELLTKFAKIIDSADIIVGQNSDRFDIKWLRTRCIQHGIPISSKFNSIDTLKMMRAGFNFNCNKLDYIGQFLGVGEKIKTSYDLWKDITLKDDKNAMKQMITYCQQDVLLLEKVYNKLKPYCKKPKFKYAGN